MYCGAEKGNVQKDDICTSYFISHSQYYFLFLTQTPYSTVSFLLNTLPRFLTVNRRHCVMVYTHTIALTHWVDNFNEIRQDVK